MAIKIFSHTVSVPPLTDVPEMLGAYRNLFDGMGIVNKIPFATSQGFTHPIQEETTKLTGQFFETMNLLNAAKAAYGNVSLVNSNIASSTVTFIFQYNE